MYDAGKIITGLIIFVGLVTFPFWYGTGQAVSAPELSYDTPAINALDEKECIEDAEFMRENHMNLLNDWRTTVVREGKRIYVSSDGDEFNMSLQNTCLECHSNYEEFCNKCHTYAEVEPDCWDCHLERGMSDEN